MAGIKDKVAIIGTGCTKFGEHWGKSAQDLIVEAVYEAITDAKIELKDIQAAWLGIVWSGESGVFLSSALRTKYIPITRVENRCGSGIDALRNAVYAVAAGAYDIVLAVGAEKLKDSGIVGVPAFGSEAHPAYTAGLGGGPAGEFAFRATRYFYRYGISYEKGKEILAKIAVKNHYNGSLNPKAHLRREITLEQAINAPIIAWPLGLFDCCPVSDGAAATVLCRAELAKNFRRDPVYIKGLGLSCGPGADYIRNDVDLTHFEETVIAGKQAFAEAGIKNPLDELSVAEVHDCFTITELLIYEDLGFCPRGQAMEYINDGIFTLQGKLPVNTDGGLKCFGHPLGASGLRMTYEICKQLQNKAEARQLKEPKIGLVHNLGLIMGGSAVCGVAILGKNVG